MIQAAGLLGGWVASSLRNPGNPATQLTQLPREPSYLENLATFYVSSCASIVIVAFSTFETGHPVLALLAAVSNACLSPPGIFARTSR